VFAVEDGGPVGDESHEDPNESHDDECHQAIVHRFCLFLVVCFGPVVLAVRELYWGGCCCEELIVRLVACVDMVTQTVSRLIAVVVLHLSLELHVDPEHAEVQHEDSKGENAILIVGEIDGGFHEEESEDTNARHDHLPVEVDVLLGVIQL